MPTFTNFKKFSALQQKTWERTRSRLLKKFPREVRKARQMDAEGRPTRPDFRLRGARAQLIAQGGPTRRQATQAFGIEVDTRLQRDMEELIELGAPTLAAAMDDRLGRLAFAAWRKWPVDTGMSRALLDVSVLIFDRGRLVRSTLASRAPYTFFIKAKNLGKKQPHRELIDVPSRGVAEGIANDALDDLARNIRPPGGL